MTKYCNMSIRLFPGEGNTKGGKNTKAFSLFLTLEGHPKAGWFTTGNCSISKVSKYDIHFSKTAPLVVPPLTLVKIHYTSSGAQAFGSLLCLLPLYRVYFSLFAHSSPIPVPGPWGAAAPLAPGASPPVRRLF